MPCDNVIHWNWFFGWQCSCFVRKIIFVYKYAASDNTNNLTQPWRMKIYDRNIDFLYHFPHKIENNIPFACLRSNLGLILSRFITVSAACFSCQRCFLLSQFLASENICGYERIINSFGNNDFLKDDAEFSIFRFLLMRRDVVHTRELHGGPTVFTNSHPTLFVLRSNIKWTPCLLIGH